MWLLTVVVCLALGLLIGYNRGRNAQSLQEEHRLALARAWQLGFEAAGMAGAAASDHAAPLAPVPPTAPQQPGRIAPPRPPDPAATYTPTESFANAQPGMATLAPASSLQPVPMRPLPTPAKPALTPEQRTLRNINITLYVAALLVVAASSLVIGLVFPALVKVIGLALLTVAFYFGGLLMHAKSERLRPAALAFTGTGLALIPITALAHYTLLGNHSSLSWFVGSLVGTAAFAFACARLNSAVLAALSTVFLVSTAWSGGAILNRGLIWYFLFSMVAASVLTLLAARRPRWLNNNYLASFTAAHRFLVPATLVAALFSYGIMAAADYAWLFTAAAAYYTVAFFHGSTSQRGIHQLAVRASLGLALGSLLLHLELSGHTIFRLLALYVLMQLVLVLSARKRYLTLTGMEAAALTKEALITLFLAAALVLAGSERLIDGDRISWSVGELNWSIPLLLLGAAWATWILGTQLRWIPLLAAVPVLLEPVYGIPGRQALVLLAASLLAVAAVQRFDPTVRGHVHLVIRALSPFTAALLFGWLAGGFAFAPWYRDGPIPPAEGLILQASGVGFIIVAIIQLLLSARRLIQHRGANPGSKSAVEPPAGERVMLPAATFASAAVLWVLTTVDTRDPFTGRTGQVWLGMPWTQILGVALLLSVLGAATLILGTRWQKPLPPVEAAQQGSVAAHPVDETPLQRGAAHLAGLLGIGLILPVFLLNEPDLLFIAGSAVALIYAGIRLLAPDRAGIRGGYAVLAQIIFTGAALRLADLWDADLHARTALAVFTLAAAQSARIWFSRRSPALEGIGLRHQMGWAAQGLLLLIPLTYAAVVGGNADQAALLVQAVCLGGFSWIWWFRGDPEPHTGRHRLAGIGVGLGVLLLVLAPVWPPGLRSGGWLPLPLWNVSVAALLCAALSVALIKFEHSNLGGPRYRSLRALFIAGFLMTLLTLTGTASARWALLAFAIVTASFLVFSATTGRALLVWGAVLGTVPAVSGGVRWWHELLQTRPSQPGDVVSALSIAAVLLMLGAMAAGRFRSPVVRLAELGSPGDGWRNAHARVMFLGAVLLLALAGLAGAVSSGFWAYAGCVLLVAAAFIAALTEVPAASRESGLEAAVLVAALAVQRGWSVYRDGIDFFWATQYWVIVLALLAAFEFLRRRSERATIVLVVAAGLLSGGALIGWTPGRQLWVLIAFVVLLAAGMLLNRRIFVIWGAIGSALMVLWFLRGFTFLLLFLLAGGLIAVALWRLARLSGRQQDREDAGGQVHSSASAQAQPPTRMPPPPPPPPAAG